MIQKKRELRSDIRTDLSYAVKYEIISPEEYYLTGKKPDFLHSVDIKKLKIAKTPSDNTGKIVSGTEINSCDNALIEFLIKMDEKLNNILSILSANNIAQSQTLSSELLNLGKGVNISASGISLITSKPASKGQIIHVDINLNKIPPLFIDAYGEIVRVKDIYEEDMQMYNLGIKFINLDEKDREKIISYIFSEQRKAIRNERKPSRRI